MFPGKYCKQCQMSITKFQFAMEISAYTLLKIHAGM